MSLHLETVAPTDRRFLSRPAATEAMLKTVGVDPKWTEHVRVLDAAGPLALLHYINTAGGESGLKEFGHVRGTIINTETNEIVCRSLPHTPELTSSQTECLEPVLGQDFQRATFYRAYEGTVIRVFFFDGEWYLSTHRKIDAHNSYWAGPTFGEMFEETRQFDFGDLDRNLCYAFLLSHNGNRLVYKIAKPQLMLVALYDRERGVFVDTKVELPGCVMPTPIEGIDSLDALRCTVEQMVPTATADQSQAGVIAILDRSNPQPIKIVNESYLAIRNARGNEPNLRARYVHVRGTVDANTLITWFKEPQYQNVFDSVEVEIDELITNLHAMYVNRYIGKDFGALPKEEFVTIQRCHSWHLEDRRKNIVRMEKVRDIVNTTPNHFLLVMLNRQRQQKRDAAKAVFAQ